MSGNDKEHTEGARGGDDHYSMLLSIIFFKKIINQILGKMIKDLYDGHF